MSNNQIQIFIRVRAFCNARGSVYVIDLILCVWLVFSLFIPDSFNLISVLFLD